VNILLDKRALPYFANILIEFVLVSPHGFHYIWILLVFISELLPVLS